MLRILLDVALCYAGFLVLLIMVTWIHERWSRLRYRMDRVLADPLEEIYSLPSRVPPHESRRA